MATEQDKILEALQIAIDIETDGKECYLKAGQESGNDAGRKLLQSLAAEEDAHRQKFLEIYQNIQKNKGWTAGPYQADNGKRLRELLAGACSVVGADVKADAAELDAINLAIDKEKRSYDLYEDRSRTAIFANERAFYQTLASEEREHELILVNYGEYLADPVDWFTRTEHHSLDGG